MKSREQIDRLIAEESAELQTLRAAIANAETSSGEREKGGGLRALLRKQEKVRLILSHYLDMRRIIDVFSENQIRLHRDRLRMQIDRIVQSSRAFSADPKIQRVYRTQRGLPRLQAQVKDLNWLLDE